MNYYAVDTCELWTIQIHIYFLCFPSFALKIIIIITDMANNNKIYEIVCTHTYLWIHLWDSGYTKCDKNKKSRVFRCRLMYQHFVCLYSRHTMPPFIQMINKYKTKQNVKKKKEKEIHMQHR